MVHLLALRCVELHLSDQVCGRAGFHALRFLAWPRQTPSGERAQARKELIWLAKIREKNRRNQAELGWKKIRRSQSKPNRARSGWRTFVGTTARRILSSRAGNGSPAGVAARWFTRRRIDPARKYLRADAAEFLPRL